MVLDTSNLIYTSSNLYDPIYPIVDLLANNSYTFYVIPFYTNIPEYYQYIKVNTLAVIGSLDITKINYDSVMLKWNRLAYAFNYVNITWTNVNLINYYNSQALNYNNVYYTGQLKYLTNTSNLIVGLSPNTPYFFTVTAYNSINVPTPSIITNTVYTLATIGNIRCTRNNTTRSSITLNWDKENYTYVKLFWTPTLLDGSSGSNLTSFDLENVATNPILNPYDSSSNIYDSSYTITNLNSNVTYNFALFPYNSNSLINSNCSTFQWTTLPNVDNVYITDINSTSVRIHWDSGNYYSTTVRIIRNNIIERQIESIRNSYIDIYNLIPNERYLFGVVPFNKPMLSNSELLRGRTVYTNYIVTLATVGALSTSNITNNSAIIKWLPGKYSYLNLQYNSYFINQSYNIYNISSNQSFIKINNLYGNMQYNIEITPFNKDNIYSSYSNILICTLPNIPFFRPLNDQYAITSNSIHLEWGSDNIYQSFNAVDIYWNNNSLLNLKGSEVIISNLNINNIYNFNLIPYNNINVPGSNLNLTLATYGTITNLISSNITINSIDFSWINSNNGLNINYFNINDQTNIYSINNLNNIKNIRINNLTPNSQYIFQFYSSNILNQITTSPYTISIKTIPIVYNLYLTNITSSSIIVNWDQNSLYEYIKLSYIEKISQITSNIYIPFGNYSYNVGNLLPNRSYSFNITPYNSSIINSNINIPNSYGNTIYSSYIYTLSDITSASVIDYTTNTIKLAWTYPSNGFNTLSIIWNNILTNSSNSRDNIIDDGFLISDGTIFPNQIYNISIVSYNAASPSKIGTTLYALKYNQFYNQYTSNIITKPTAGRILLNSLSTNAIDIYWGNIDYFAYVNITLSDINSNVISTINNYTNNAYVFNNLISNAIYSISILPFNRDSPAEVGNYSYISLNTLATVGPITLLNLTDTSINIQWGQGTYSTVTIQWSIFGSTLINTAYSVYGDSSNLTNLVSNKKYNISVYPNNSNYSYGNNPVGTPSLYTIVTYATINNAYVNNITAYTADLTWYGGTFSSISIQWLDINHNINNPNIINPDKSLYTYTVGQFIPNTSNILQIIPYNSDGILSYNNSIYTDQFVTLGYISYAELSNITDNSVYIKLNNGTLLNEYYNFDIKLYNTNNSLITQNIKQTGTLSYINTGINPNTNYYITLLPYNSINIPNNSYNNILSFTSLATIGTINPPIINTSSISLLWNPANSTYAIVTWDPPSINNINTSGILTNGIYTINNLSSNVQYNINIIPYNSINVPNTINYGNIVKYTLPIITNATSQISNDQSQINILWSGYYSTVNIIVYDEFDNVLLNRYINGNSYIYSPLNADRKYIINLIPYNPDNTPGSAIVLNNFTLPVIRTFYITAYTDTTVSLNWFNTNNAKSGGVGISWTPPDNFTSEIVFKTDNSYTVTGLKPNVNYTFTASPSNSAVPPQIGNQITTSVLTLPNVTNVNNILYTNYAISTVSGGYSNILISWSNLLVYNSPTYSNYFLSTATNSYITSNILPDSLYKFTYTPFNNYNITGNTYTISSTAAAATVGPITSYYHASNNIKLIWENIGYYYEYVYNTYNNIYTTKQYGNTNELTGLTPNTTYYISVIPVNKFDNQNLIDAQYTRVCTLPIIIQNSLLVDTNTILAYSLNVIFNSYCDYAIVSYISSGKSSNIYVYGPFMNSNVSVPITGLNANTSYNFSVTPFNTSNEIGETFTTSTVKTKSIINYAIATNITSNSLLLDWYSTGTYDAIRAYWNSIVPSGLNGNQILTVKPQNLGPDYNNIFYPNTLYSLQILPTVGVGANIILGISSPYIYVNTLPIIGSTITISNLIDTSVFLSWNNTGYTYVNIYWYESETNILVNSYSNLYTNNYSISNLTPNKSYKSLVLPYNLCNINGNGISTTFTTLTTINKDTSTYINMTADSPTSYSSTATLYWSGTYNYIKYYYSWTDYNGVLNTTNRVLINTSLSPNSAIISSGLLPNIKYTFTIEPYNTNNIIGMIYSLSSYTLPNLVSGYIGASNDTTATIYWSTNNLYDRYSNVYITSIPDSGTNIGITPPYNVSNLLPNTSYIFTITPYNSDIQQKPGHSITLPSILTYASLTNTSLTATINSFNNISFSGIYSYVIIKYVNNIGTYYTGTLTDGTNVPNITNLISNKQYTITFIPYNTNNSKPNDQFLQNSPYTIVTSTLASTTVINTVSTINSITITWTKSNNNYNYLIITWFQITGNIVDYSTQSSGQLFYSLNDNGTYTLNNLISYTTYQININAYNINNVPYQLTPINVTTLVFITSVLPTNVTSNSVSIRWIGEYYFVKVYSSFNPTPVTLNVGETSYTFNNTNGNLLSANTSYTFYVIPYDNNTPPNAGVIVNIVIKTLPQLSSVTSVTNIGSVNATVNWSGNYANVKVDAITSDNITTATTTLSGNSYQFTTLIPNTYYIFTITPFNNSVPYSDGSVFNQGNSVTTSPAILTLGLIRNLRVIQFTTNNISLQWDPNLFTTVNIQLALNGSTIQYINNLIGNVYDFSNYLTPCSKYTITIFAINSAGTINNTQPSIENIISASTLPIIDTFTVSQITYNSITVSWSGYVTKINLQWLGTDGTQGNIIGYTGSSYNTYTTGSLSINTKYTFTLTPFNIDSQAGVVKSLQATTLATIGPITAGTPSINSVDMSWTSGTYSYIVFSWTGTSVGRSINVLSSPFTILGLLINGVYTISATPYNIDNSPGTPVISNTIYTLPLIDSFNIINITTNNMTIRWSGSYTRLDITWTGTAGPTSGTLTNISGNSYNFGGYLTPGATYTFTLIPYNSNGVSNIYTPSDPSILSATTLT